MSEKRFSYAQRYVLWRAYDMKCFYCDRPLDFRNLTIDHVIPESLNEEKLTTLLRDYGILRDFPDFSVNDYSNWVPSDGYSCNNRKGALILPKTFTVFLLNRIQNNLEKVAAELTRLTKQRDETKVLSSLGIAIESGVTTKRQILRLLWDLEFERTQDEPLIITYGVNIVDSLETSEFPEELKCLRYAILCDGLEAQLSEFLRTITDSPFHYSEQSHRDGEVLSVRLVFPLLKLDDYGDFNPWLVENVMPWWELLEVTNFYQVYNTKYQEAQQD
jgi:hypothetical protein